MNFALTGPILDTIKVRILENLTTLITCTTESRMNAILFKIYLIVFLLITISLLILYKYNTVSSETILKLSYWLKEL